MAQMSTKAHLANKTSHTVSICHMLLTILTQGSLLYYIKYLIFSITTHVAINRTLNFHKLSNHWVLVT